MSLAETLRADLTDAMRRRDEVATGALRMALSEVRTAETSGKQARTLDDAGVRQVLASQVKRREEAAEAYRKAGREEQAVRELAERDVLAAYLPARLTEAEITEIVDEALAAEGLRGSQAMGAAMKAVMSRVEGRADGKVVSGIVRQRLGT